MKKIIIAVALAATPAPALASGFTYYLVEQWVNNTGMRFCRYSNGAVIAAGYSICPLSIRG